MGIFLNSNNKGIKLDCGKYTKIWMKILESPSQNSNVIMIWKIVSFLGLYL